MKEAVNLQVELRDPGSSNQARRLRREGKLPAVLYGGEREARAIVVDPKTVVKILRSEQGENTILNLTVGEGQEQTALIHDYQVDPLDHRITHADFLRISMDVEVEVHVPVHLRGEPAGVRKEDGVLDTVLRELTVTCLPGNIPDFFEVDVTELEIGDSVHVFDLEIPEDVTVHEEPEQTVAVVAPPQELEIEEPEEEEDLLAEAEEPELIGAEEEGEEGEELEEGEQPPEEEAG